MSRRVLWISIVCGIPLLAAMPGACSAPAPRPVSPAPPSLLLTTSRSTPTVTSQPTTTPATTAPATTAPTLNPRRPTSNPQLPLLTTLKEGTYLADRLGQFTYNPLGPYSYFYFYQAGKRVEIELLPNRALMAIEQAAFWDPHLRFRVSGTITSYNGRNYLLVQRVTKALPPTQPATTLPSTRAGTQPTSQP